MFFLVQVVILISMLAARMPALAQTGDPSDLEPLALTGEQLSKVKQALITPVRERWGEGRDKVAEVSKKWFRLRDSYGVSIDPGQDDVLILAVAVCIDEMAHDGR